MDDLDLVILDALRENARVTTAELGRRTKLSPRTVADRLRRMEESGVVVGYHAIIDPAKFGFPARAFIHVKATRDNYAQVIAAARELPEIREAHHIGETCGFMLSVVARDSEDLQRLCDVFASFGDVQAAPVLSTPVQKYST